MNETEWTMEVEVTCPSCTSMFKTIVMDNGPLALLNAAQDLQGWQEEIRREAMAMEDPNSKSGALYDASIIGDCIDRLKAGLKDFLKNG